MVCSTCGIQGHNKRTCKQLIKEDKHSVCANATRLLNDSVRVHGKPDKIKKTIILFDFLVFHKWMVLSHERFRKSVLNKLTQFESEDFPNIDYYRKNFTKKEVKVKKIKTDECPICYDKLEDINVATTKCGHSICLQCMMEYLKRNNTKCPLCREKLS